MILDQEISADPYWWEERVIWDGKATDINQKFDVVIVGSGYTGLNAALELASKSLNVAVIEAKNLGEGASTRNGGMVSGTLKLKFSELNKIYGQDLAKDLFNEAQFSVSYLENLISKYNFDCDYQNNGMYFAAFSKKHYKALELESAELNDLGIKTKMIQQSDQYTEIGSDSYFGGRITINAGGLHPAKYHKNLVEECVKLGVTFIPQFKVKQIKYNSGKYECISEKGVVQSEEVIIATNAYTNNSTKWMKRRLIPIGSYIIATNQIDKEILKRCIPSERMVQDTKRNLFYYRISPDGTRMIFGGRTSFKPIGNQESAKRLYASMVNLFPELKTTTVDYSWTGNVAFTFNKIPNIGTHNGLHYALGCCGQGVSMMSYLGNQMARNILDNSADTAFRHTNFTTIPFYNGNPWFVPYVGQFYNFLDNLDSRSN